MQTFFENRTQENRSLLQKPPKDVDNKERTLFHEYQECKYGMSDEGAWLK